MNELLRDIRRQHPPFKLAVLEDARATLEFRGEPPLRETRADAIWQLARLALASDAFLAQVCYRAKASLQRRGIPVLPRLLHRLAMMTAQVSIGDPVVVQPGLYLPHGQVVVDGLTAIGSRCVLFPWTTIGLVAGQYQGPTIGDGVHVGTGAKVLGPVTVGMNARVGANAVVLHDVAAGMTVVGAPARPTRSPSDSTSDLDPLAAAEELVAAKRVDEAISLLTEHNRHRPSADVEHRLVALRHQAFLAARPHPVTERWGNEVPGRFAGVTGVPEITASELSAEALRAGILGKGSLIVRNLLGPDAVARLAADVRASIEASHASHEGRADESHRPFFYQFDPDGTFTELSHDRHWVRDGGGVLAADSPRSLFDLIDVFEASGVIEVLTEYLGERPALSVKKTTLREVQPLPAAEWHQDGAFLGTDIRSVNVWIALSDCGVDAPSMDIVSRRLDELAPSGVEGAYFWWSVSDKVARDVAGDAPIVRPVFRAGDAIVFDHMNLHRTATDPAFVRPRLAIEAWFFAPSSYPLDQIPIAV